MKTAILSDLHGNDLALELVLRDAKRKEAGELLIAGDFVGYYYHPEKLFTLLNTWKWEGIQGNHDALFASFISGNDSHMNTYRASYGSALDRAAQTLSAEEKSFLFSLPEKKEFIRDGKKILMCHGSPWQQDAYIYPDAPEELFARIAKLGHDIVILGNTHYPFIKKSGACIIINPGSVGQPRDESSNTSWALADFAAGTVEIHRVRFSPEDLIKEILTYDASNSYLREVLVRKKNTHAKKQ